MTKPRGNMEVHQISVQPDMWAQLEQVSRETGAPVSELIRRAIAKWLEERVRRA